MVTASKIPIFICVFLLSFFFLSCGENETRETFSPLQLNLMQLQTSAPLPEGNRATEAIVRVGEKEFDPFPIVDGIVKVPDGMDYEITDTFGPTNISVEYLNDSGKPLYTGNKTVEIREEGSTEVTIQPCPVNHQITARFTIPVTSRRILVSECVRIDDWVCSSTHFSKESLEVEWDWGKDEGVTNFSGIKPGDKTPEHCYKTPGKKLITLTVKDKLDQVAYDRDRCGKSQNTATASIPIDVSSPPQKVECLDLSSRVIDKQIELPEFSSQVTITGQNQGGEATFEALDCAGVTVDKKTHRLKGDFKVVLDGKEICIVQIKGQELFVERLCYQF